MILKNSSKYFMAIVCKFTVFTLIGAWPLIDSNYWVSAY